MTIRSPPRTTGSCSGSSICRWPTSPAHAATSSWPRRSSTSLGRRSRASSRRAGPRRVVVAPGGSDAGSASTVSSPVPPAGGGWALARRPAAVRWWRPRGATWPPRSSRGARRVFRRSASSSSTSRLVGPDPSTGEAEAGRRGSWSSRGHVREARRGALGRAGLEQLARIGGRPSSPFELTDTEQQIAALVAQGRTDRETAGALFVSPSTVGQPEARHRARRPLPDRARRALAWRG
jgi:hypothetical protein